MSADAERAWGALLRVHARLVPRFDAEVQAAASMPLTWYDVLLELQLGRGRLTMSELGARATQPARGRARGRRSRCARAEPG